MCFGPVVVPPVHIGAVSILVNKLIGYVDDSNLIAIIVLSPGDRVTVAGSLKSDLDKVSEWCDF